MSPVTQIFNTYLEKGGEELFVDELEQVFGPEGTLNTLRFHSSDWAGEHAPSRISQAFRMLWNPASIRVLRDHEDQNPSSAWILHNVFPVGSAAIYRQALRWKIPLIVYTHNFRPYSVSGYLWAKGGISEAGLRKNYLPEIFSGAWRGSRLQTAWYAFILYGMHVMGLYRRVDLWVAISDCMRTAFIEAGVPEERIQTIRHSWRCRPLEQIQVTDSGQYLFLGRLVEMKGVLFLADSWNRLMECLGEKTPILNICGDGPDEAKLRAKLRHNPFVKFHGRVAGERKEQLLASCRALLVPSIWKEPLGLIVYEAYEFTKPVIACDIGGLPEIVIQGETGILVDPGSVPSLLSAISFSEANAKEMKSRGKQGRNFVEQEADPERWKHQVESAIQSVCDMTSSAV